MFEKKSSIEFGESLKLLGDNPEVTVSVVDFKSEPFNNVGRSILELQGSRLIACKWYEYLSKAFVVVKFIGDSAIPVNSAIGFRGSPVSREDDLCFKERDSKVHGDGFVVNGSIRAGIFSS